MGRVRIAIAVARAPGHREAAPEGGDGVHCDAEGGDSFTMTTPGSVGSNTQLHAADARANAARAERQATALAAEEQRRAEALAQLAAVKLVAARRDEVVQLDDALRLPLEEAVPSQRVALGARAHALVADRRAARVGQPLHHLRGAPPCRAGNGRRSERRIATARRRGVV